jgi:hypothetical protein
MDPERSGWIQTGRYGFREAGQNPETTALDQKVLYEIIDF